MSTLRETFLEELGTIYDAEKQLLKALPKMAQAAGHEDLRHSFEEHLEQTEEHIARIEQVAESLDETLKRKTCQAMKGLIAEGEDIVKEQKNSTALDAGIIAACQKVEHYEIASYGTLCAWAEQMGHDEALRLLGETEEEILQVMRDLREHNVDMLTIGQYLQPSEHHLPVRSYVHPDTFKMYEEEAYKMGFTHAAVGAMVRSSYHADLQAHGAGVV